MCPDDDIVYVLDPASGAFLHTFIPSLAGGDVPPITTSRSCIFLDENNRTGVYAYDANGQLITRPDRSSW